MAFILAFLAASTLSAASGASGATSQRGVLIDAPLYSETAAGWSTVLLASPAIDTIVFNPSSGPGDAPQPFYLSLVASAQATGLRVLGYVPTSWANGAVSVAEAEAWVKEYYAWYRVDGIAFDQVSDTCSSGPIGYYTDLYNFVKQQTGADIVVLNPGTAVGECYAKVSDVLVTFEGTYADYLQYQPPSWVRSYPGSHFLNIILDTPAKEMKNAVNLAVERNSDRVYITDKGANGGDPYASLPSYFGLEASYVSSPVRGTNVLELVGGPTVGSLEPNVTLVYRNEVPANLTGLVYFVVHNPVGQAVYLSTSKVALAPGANFTATLTAEGLPHGSYNATVFVEDSGGVAMSEPESFALYY